MSKKDKVYMVLAVIVGIGMVGFGIMQLSSDTLQCGSQEMEAGDTCTHVRNDSSHENDYAQERAAQVRTAWIVLGVGALMVVGGGAFLLTGNKKPKPAPPQAGHPQQRQYPQQHYQQPPYPQQQQYPPGQQPPR